MSSFKEAAMSFAVKKAVKYARKDFDKKRAQNSFIVGSGGC